jgi:hypothetical protein
LKKDNLSERYLSSLKTDKVGTAWQYIVREEKRKEEEDDPYWQDLNLSLKETIIKPVDISLAKEIIEEYEWLGCMPAIVIHCYGIFFGDVCGGVVVFSTEYAENLGVWDKYGYTGKMILLSRGVCLHWTPKNTNSKLIMGAIRQLPKKFEVITATVDALAGEIGTIYQACNFHYVGVMRKSKTRLAVIIDGKLYGSRSMRAKFGTQKRSIILKKHSDAKFIKQKSKERYFLFRGKDKERHLDSISHLIKPYPKRKNE